MISKNPCSKAGGRLDVTFADEVCEASETCLISLIERLSRAKLCLSSPGKMAGEQ